MEPGTYARTPRLQTREYEFRHGHVIFASQGLAFGAWERGRDPTIDAEHRHQALGAWLSCDCGVRGGGDTRGPTYSRGRAPHPKNGVDGGILDAISSLLILNLAFVIRKFHF